MNGRLLKDALGWGFLLWLIGYVLGIILFFAVPPTLIGWVVMPIGVVITLWVLLRWVSGSGLGYYAILAVAWTLMAVALDYLFVIKLLAPADGYYKLDVYLYYVLTFCLPFATSWWKARRPASE